MNKEQYDEKRNTLMDETQNLIDEGKLDEADAKMDEVKTLDDEWEKTCKAQANMNALKDSHPAVDIKSVSGKADVGMTPADKIDLGKADAITAENAYKTDAYKTAWAKSMMGRPMSDEESRIYHLANEYVHTTGNTGEVIPETVAQGIWSEIEDMYPYYADITKTYVSGLLTVIKAKDTTDAGWYDEATATEDAEEKFETATLSGCELSRSVTVSYKLTEMAIEDFIPYIQRRLAERMGAGLGYGMTNGLGADATKPEPLGVVTALKSKAADQVVSYTAGSLTYADITSARGKIKSGYAAGLAIYANSTTIWGDLANVKDNNGRPLFVPDPTSDGVYRILGLVVKEDASFADGDVLLSNASRGYQANINRQMTVEQERHVKARTVDYAAYAIADGAPLTYKAHALLTTSAGTETAKVATAKNK